jgi:8-oxo-dGTP pyrophosphatase MutT (NUDIX family)
MIKRLLIGPARIKIELNDKFTQLSLFLNQFPSFQEGKEDGSIFIDESNKKNIKLDKKNKALKISGPDLDNLNDPLVKIFILQMLFRLANFVTLKNPYILMHGSSAIWEDKKAIIFGDDGKNIGKTISSVLIGQKSGKFVSDEFSFYDVKNNKILSFDFLPVHLREFYVNDLNKIFKKKFKAKNLLMQAQDLGLEFCPENQLSMIIYPYFSKNKSPKIIKLSKKEAAKSLDVLAMSHMVKFLKPKFDRASWLKNSDLLKVQNISAESAKLASQTKPFLAQVLQKVASYKIIFNKPEQIVKLVSKAVQLEKRNVIEHRSASAVVYFNVNNEVKILMLKKKNGNWVLPKGHIDPGEKPSEAALREAKEEGGLEKGRVVKFLGSSAYSFQPDYSFAKQQKTVLVYLVKGEKIKPKALEYEGFEESALLSPQEAVDKVSFDEEKKVIKKALNIIKNSK